MGTRAKGSSWKDARTSDAKARSAIPKMGLNGTRRVEAGSHVTRNSHLLKTFETLIQSFGEFKLLMNADGTIGAVWASRTPETSLAKEIVPGRRLREILAPSLRREIEQMAWRTGESHHREDVEYQVDISGSRRWFSVGAIPLVQAREGKHAILLVARDVTHRVDALTALGEREALLANAEQVANFGSWELDIRTNRVTLSSQLRKIFNLEPGERWTPEIYWQRIHPSDRERVRAIAESGTASGNAFQYVARYCAPDGRIRMHLVHSVPLFNENGKPSRAIGVVQDITDQVHANQELLQFSQKLIDEQDNARRQLARELHESAGQSLAALKMTLVRLRDALPDDAQLAASLLKSATLLADGAVREVRTVSYLLHPPMLDDAGLGPALRWYGRGFSERSGIRVLVDIPEPFGRYSREIETTVFRVVQEALTNVHRYSGSEAAEIRVRQTESKLRVEVRDYGSGLSPMGGAGRGQLQMGVGIPGMRERVQKLDGVLDIDSAPGQGTTVRVFLPATPMEEASKIGITKS